LLKKGCCCAVSWGCWGELNVVVRCKMLEWWGCWGSCWLDCVVNVLHRGDVGVGWRWSWVGDVLHGCDVGVGWRWGWVVIVQRWAIVVLGLWVC